MKPSPPPSTCRRPSDPRRSTRLRRRRCGCCLFTGCRLREILHLRWEHVDFERGCLFLPDSKSGRKTVILNAPALAVLNGLERIGPYVVPGDDPEQPRHDLKRPWDAVTKRAGLTACACTICGTPTRASVPVAGWACRSSAGCWATLRRQPPRAMRISTMIRCGALQRPSQDALRPRWTAIAKILWCQCGGELARNAPSHRTAPLYPRKADMCGATRHVCFVPIAD